jgi:hydroxyethylthiazole kinase-like uncharacterized protein yjeF
MKDFLSKSELRNLDNKAKRVLSIPENILIENAARGIREVIEDKSLPFGRVCILAGQGNNGADSLALARQLLIKGAEPDIFLIGAEKKDNLQVKFQLGILKKVLPAENIFRIDKEEKISLLKDKVRKSELVVDGIFGIGFRLDLDDFYKKIFRLVNKENNNILAVDIPSGLTCDEGVIDEVCLEAKWTVTFIALKLGFFKGKGSAFTGEVFLKDIGISRDILEKV